MGKKAEKPAPEFNATLLREKFVISDTMPADFSDEKPVIALSNRMTLPLVSEDESAAGQYIVRAQNMHGCVRFAGRLYHEFVRSFATPEEFSRLAAWESMFKSTMSDYEEKWNEEFWIAVYFQGRVLFESGKRHAFLDIIEQCDVRNKGHYEKSLSIAEDAFKQAGKLVTIDYNANLALNVHIGHDKGRCGIILRGPSRTTTFNFTAVPTEGGDEAYVKVAPCLQASAEFLEVIQLAFMAGVTKKRLEYEMIDRHSDEAVKAKDAQYRLGALNREIRQFEELYDISYRPERPDIQQIVADAEHFAETRLGAR